MQDWAKWFYKSKEWLKCRAVYFKTQHGLCEKCGDPGYIVHHIIWITPANIYDVNITLNFDNLMLLCLSCHGKIHGFAQSTAEGLKFDKNGDLIRVGTN